jgi:hypothetical protein
MTQCKEYLYINVSSLWGKCLSHKAAHNSVEKFSQGRSEITDDAQPVCPVEIETESTVQRVGMLIRADRRIPIDSVATALRCSHGLAYRIMNYLLKFRKVCARWVTRELKDREKINRMDVSLQHLLRYADEGEDMLNKIVTGEESWVHHYQPESKRTSMQWKHPSSLSTESVRY